ncbi:pilin [Patescibacteria group bacterium]|nr:pilin [Patescibacteria group bacterium]MBU1685291.1 pilin [Patescibacteria group bacterium]MBU1938322.1 pilin [Patescibacteria group bacterium]
MKRRFYFILGVALLLPLTAASAFGLTLEDFRKDVYRPENLPGGQTGAVSAENKVINAINFLVNLILFASGSVAVLMLIWGGIRLVTSAGDSEQKEKATGVIKNAAFGLAIVILAYALVTNIINLIFRATT